MVRECTEALSIYHKKVLDEIVPAVPTYFFRYEDLRTKPKETLEGIFAFLLNVKSIEGLNIQRRIEQVVNLGHEASITYKVKTDEKKKILFNRNIDQFTDEQRACVTDGLKDFMHQFGYADQGEEQSMSQEWL